MRSIRDIATVGFGGISAQVLTAGTMPVITRFYSPEAYASWSILISVVLIFASVATLRYELAVVLPKTDEEASNVMASCVIVATLVCVLAAAIVPMCGSFLVGERFYFELVQWIWTIPLLILISGVYQACICWCIRTREFVWFSVLQVVVPFFTVTGQIAAALAGWNNACGLVSGTVAGQFSAAIIILVLINWKYGKRILSSITFKGVKQVFFKYKNFPLYSTPYTLAGTIRDRLVYFLLGNFGAGIDVGFYSLSTRLMNMPNSLVAGAVRPVFFQKAASVDLRSLEGTILQALRCLIVCVAPFCAILFVHHLTLFQVVFGEEWKEAGLYAVIISTSAIPLLMTNWLDRSFDVLGRQRLALWLEGIFSALSLSAVFVGLLVLDSSLLAIGMQSVVLGIYYGCWIITLFQIAGFSKANLAKLACLFLWLTVLSCALTWILSLILPPLCSIAGSISLAVMVSGLYLHKQKKVYRDGRK